MRDISGTKKESGFVAHCFTEIIKLTGDEGGDKMPTKYEEKGTYHRTSREELKDIDSKRDLENLGKRNGRK